MSLHLFKLINFVLHEKKYFPLCYKRKRKQGNDVWRLIESLGAIGKKYILNSNAYIHFSFIRIKNFLRKYEQAVLYYDVTMKPGDCRIKTN